MEVIRLNLKVMRGKSVDTYSYYKTMYIPKGNGKLRTLHLPNEKLKKTQNYILEEILYKLAVSPYAHCAVPGRSIFTNVEPHKKSSFFFKLDFKDAFPTVTREMVAKTLAKECKRQLNKDLNKDTLNILVNCTILPKGIPQGAPTSPYLLNLVLIDLDEDLAKIARRKEMVFTRYADDIVFSSSSEIKTKERRKIINTIIEHGFRINTKKTVYRSGKAVLPKITGIYLQDSEDIFSDRKTILSKKQIDIYRAVIYNSLSNPLLYKDKVFGIVNWVKNVYEGNLPKRLQSSFDTFSKRLKFQIEQS